MAFSITGEDQLAAPGTATQAYLHSVGGALTGGDVAGGLAAVGPEATNSLVADAAGGGGRSDDGGDVRQRSSVRRQRAASARCRSSRPMVGRRGGEGVREF